MGKFQVGTRTDSKGRKQPAKKPERAPTEALPPAPTGCDLDEADEHAG